MGGPLFLQFSIPLFTGMVAATFIPPVRKAIPKPLEILLWAAFVTACVAGVTSVRDANARELTGSVLWGADQILNNAVGLMIGGLAFWVSDHRFAIGSGLVMVAGTDIFVLMLLGSHRGAQPWKPRVRLGEWMEFPIPAPGPTLSHPQLEPDPLMVVNRRLRTWTAVAAFAAFTRSIEVSLWVRDAMLPPHETQRLAGLASLREAGEHLRFAIWSWFVVVVEPLLERLTASTAWALKHVARESGEIVDIRALLSAQRIGWYGPLSSGPTPAPGRKDSTESQPSNRLAS